MGYQIIQQPDGTYALWSSVVDAPVVVDCTPSDIIEIMLEEEAQRLTQSVNSIIADLQMGKKPYHQFTMTWDEMLQRHLKVHGIPFSLEEARRDPEGEQAQETRTNDQPT